MIHLSKCCKTRHWTPIFFKMTGRRSARISSRTSNGEPGIVDSASAASLNSSLAADSLVNGVGTVSAVQKRRLSAALEPLQPPPTKKSKPKKGKKAETKEKDDGGVFAVPAIPVTPTKRRRQTSATAPTAPPLSTPTPSGVSLIANNDPDPATPEKNKTPRRRRRVDPHATNAPLQTPGGTRLTSYPSSILESGSQTPLGSQQSDILTTDNLLERACAHLVAIDPRLKPLIDQHQCKLFSPEGLAEEVNPFTALASGIIGQQVRNCALFFACVTQKG